MRLHGYVLERLLRTGSHMEGIHWAYAYRRLEVETNREINFGFGSCVRARGLVVIWKSGVFLPVRFSLFPFGRERLFLFP